MKKILLCAIMMVFLAAPFILAQDQEGPAGVVWILGPRVGACYTVTKPEDFDKGVHKIYPWSTGTYFPLNSLFCVTLEQRILLGETKSHFAFQEVLSLAGLEQNFALPSLSVMVGYRDYSGLEFGIGPILSFQGVGVQAGLGWTFSFKGVNIPLDINYILPNPNGVGTFGVTTGFNFKISRNE
jgi:hypothetical protein